MTTDRLARAEFVKLAEDKYDCLVLIRAANGDYYELTALDRYHAEQKLNEFARANNLILTEVAGFSGSRASRANESGEHAGRDVVSPVAASRNRINRRAAIREVA